MNPNDHFSDFQFYGVNFEVVPEPSTLGLIGLGLLGLGAMRRRRHRPLRRLNNAAHNGVVRVVTSKRS